MFRCRLPISGNVISKFSLNLWLWYRMLIPFILAEINLVRIVKEQSTQFLVRFSFCLLNSNFQPLSRLCHEDN